MRTAKACERRAVLSIAAVAALCATAGVSRRAFSGQPADGAPRPAETIRQVGLCYTGFGVPGSGRPLACGDLVLVNAGEGCLTVCDVADKRAMKVARYIPTWFFTTHIYPLPSRDLAYLSSSRGPLLVLQGLKTLAQGGEVKEIRWSGRKGSFLSALRPDGIAYTVAGESIVVLDLNDPAQPRELKRIPQPRLKGQAAKKEAHLLTLSDDCQLAALLVDGGQRVALLRCQDAMELVPCGEIENASLTEGGKTVYGRVLAMDKRRLVIGHPASTSEYWRCFRLTFWDIGEPDRPRKASEFTFDFPGTHIRDLVLSESCAYAVDGRDISSGHTVRREQRSRLYVLDLSDLAAPKVAATCDESMPTEYSQLTLSGDTLYVNDYNFGLWAFDRSNPLRPAKLGGVPTAAEGHWLYLHGDHAFVAHTFGGTVHVINVADPAKPRTVGYYWDGQWLNYKAKIRGKDNAMYLPQSDGLAIVDITDPGHPRRAGEFLDASDRPLAEPCLDVSGDLALVATSPTKRGPPRLLVYDISDPLKPRRVGACDLPGKAGYRVLAAGRMLYLVAYGGKRVLAMDVSDTQQLRITADLAASEVQIGDETLSLAINDGGGNGVPGLACSRGYLYVTTSAEAPAKPYLLIFDVRDPAAIRPAGAVYVRDRKGWQYFVCDVLVEGSRLYLGDYGCEEAYDLSDPLHPRLLAQYRRSYAWQVGSLRGRYLYVPKLDGLEILETPVQGP